MGAGLKVGVLLVSVLAACKEGAVEPATLAGGETITYALEGRTQGPVLIEATETGYRISAPASGLPPMDVAANLRKGREQIPFFDLGILWLEPSQRMVGGKTHLGTVVGEELKAQRPALKMQERNGRVDYWFCKETGFLVQRRVNPAGPTLSLVSSTIPGL